MNKTWEEEIENFIDAAMEDIREMLNSSMRELVSEQKTLLLSRVREEVIEMRQDFPKGGVTREFNIGKFRYNAAISDVLKKLEIISEEGK